MYGALTGEKHDLPFGLTIYGTPWGNLFRIPTVSAIDAGDHPFVLPESVQVSSAIDDRGGALSFDIHYRSGSLIDRPWSVVDYGTVGQAYANNIPDNALVEFRALRTGSTNGDPIFDRLFIGFVESVEARPYPGGTGTITTVNCVSTNALLDRIIVRKAIPKNKRGQSAGRFTVRAGSDQYQIREILKHVAAKRAIGNVLLFNARDYRQITRTVPRLPKLEISISTLREALESVLEAAQEIDGRKRTMQIDPATGALQYSTVQAGSDIDYNANDRNSSPGFGDVLTNDFVPGRDPGFGLAPFEIVDNPADENLTVFHARNAYQVAAALRPAILYNMGGPDFFKIERSAAGFTKNRPAAYLNTGAAKGGNLVDLSLPAGRNQLMGTEALVPVRWYDNVSLNLDWPGPSSVSWGIPVFSEFDRGARHVAFKWNGSRSLSTWIGYGTKLVIGGEANGIVLESTYLAGAGYEQESTLTLTFDGVAYDLSDRPLLDLDQGGGVNHSASDHVVFVYDADNELVSVQVNGQAVVDLVSQSVPATAPTRVLRLDRVDEDVPGAIGLTAWWNRALSSNEMAELWSSGSAFQRPNAIAARDLIFATDHSRIYKAATFLAADSKADRDTLPDPYTRRYDQKGVDLPRRPGVRFEALVEAATVRSGTPSQRSTKISKLAKAYFEARSAPRVGGSFSIRGAGTQPGQELGFAGGWAYGGFGGGGADVAFFADGRAYIPNAYWGETDNSRYPGTSYRLWKAGQTVRIQSAVMSGYFLITSVTMSFEPGGFIRRFDIEFGSVPKRSIAQLLIAE